MDLGMRQAPMASAMPVRNEMRFEGSGGEYFKIWIVNLALTVVTLGIFSAWAKVRSRRYFYGNSFLGAHTFDYHAEPLRILLGRIIAAALLLGYSITAAMAPALIFVWGLLFLVALPWLVRSSLRFNARNTSYRNVRFDFTGTYGGAFKAFIVWPVFAAITLFTTLPLSHRARDYYNINNHSFGGKYFEARIPGGKLYLIYLLALVVLMVGVVLAGTIAMSSGLFAAFNAAGRGTPPPAVLAPAIVMLSAVYIVVLLFLGVFIGTMTFNLALNSTRLGEKFQLESTLSPFAMVWITLSNLFLTLITLGLFYPWARVRQVRYTARHIALIGDGNGDEFTSSLTDERGAVGEEVASFLDLDFGL